ncbi:hypothetical protein D5282_24420 [bacterium 1xD8-48]|nr:hypothetical protein [bacterium 1xD8-48]
MSDIVNVYKLENYQRVKALGEKDNLLRNILNGGCSRTGWRQLIETKNVTYYYTRKMEYAVNS